jgi:hypothetical protein
VEESVHRDDLVRTDGGYGCGAEEPAEEVPPGGSMLAFPLYISPREQNNDGHCGKDIPSSEIPHDFAIFCACSDTSPVIYARGRRDRRSHFSDTRCDHEVHARYRDECIDDTGWTAVVKSNDLLKTISIAT